MGRAKPVDTSVECKKRGEPPIRGRGAKPLDMSVERNKRGEPPIRGEGRQPLDTSVEREKLVGAAGIEPTTFSL